MWKVSALADRPDGIYTGQSSESAADTGVTLPTMTLSEHVVHDYESMSLSLKKHPVALVREKLTQLNILTNAGLADFKDGARVKVSGLVLVRQRPGTAAGVLHYYRTKLAMHTLWFGQAFLKPTLKKYYAPHS